MGGGVFGRPTVVNNVETLLCVPRHHHPGAGVVRRDRVAGLPGAQGLLPLGHVTRPGVYEAPMGLPLRELVYGEAYGQGVPGGRAVKAVSPGALGRADDQRRPSWTCSLDTDALRAAPYRSQLGAGGVIVYDETPCVVELLRRTEEFFAHEFLWQVRPLPRRDALDGGPPAARRRRRGRRRRTWPLLEAGDQPGGLPAHQRTLCALADFAAGPVLGRPCPSRRTSSATCVRGAAR